MQLSDSTLLFIALDNGYRVIEYTDGGWGEAGSWVYLNFPGGVKLMLAKMIVDGEGLIHAAAYAANSSQAGMDRWFYDGYYLTFDGTTWSVPVNLSSTMGVARDVGIAFDGNSHPHLLWSDPNSRHSSESSKPAIWERVYDGDTWTASAEVTGYRQNQVVNTFSVRAGVTGTPHPAWSEGALVQGTQTAVGIHYQEGDGAVWGPEQAVQTWSGESRDPALDATGDDLHMIWQEGPDEPRDVYHSRLFDGHRAPVAFFLPLARR